MSGVYRTLCYMFLTTERDNPPVGGDLMSGRTAKCLLVDSLKLKQAWPMVNGQTHTLIGGAQLKRCSYKEYRLIATREQIRTMMMEGIGKHYDPLISFKVTPSLINDLREDVINNRLK